MATIVSTLFLSLLFHLNTQVHCAENSTIANLRRDLFKDYSIDLRPVIDYRTTTNVTYRILFDRLLDMDTREQTFTVATWVKATWEDEFLRWNPEDHDGITTFNVPVTSIWTPDIVLSQNAGNGFASYKSGTRALIYSDGTVIWFVPVIYKSACAVTVQWFPFDTQVCDMTFLSWSYTGLQINLQPEQSADASQDRYSRNGVWDLVAFRPKSVITYYLCCPEPYPEVHIRLVFKRHPTFYIYYMVLPCLFLSVLSLLVFYLPPDCGEKLTLSITNLLALVVFQQLIAANMPPSSESSPVIGTYFMCMIAMVCMSVLLTCVVIHISGFTQRMSPWMKRLFLEIIPRRLCLSPYPFHDRFKECKNTAIVENGKNVLIIENGKVDVEEETDVSIVKKGVSSGDEKILKILDYMKEDVKRDADEDLEHLQWKRLSIIIDRIFLYLFSVFTIVCTVFLSVQIVVGSAEEYENIMADLNENWPLLG